eukprot:m.502238 g.502238  ORF g.502238 m.502238 type:complete len:365 (+) comp21842_c1_seq37:276-1370(+)
MFYHNVSHIKCVCVVDFHSVLPVFVDPEDTDEPFWWPALLVPRGDHALNTDVMPDITPAHDGTNLVVVQRFSDGAYVNVSLQRVAAFVVGMRPFSDYTKARGSGFLMHPAVHWATEYCIHGILPKHMGWKSMTMQTLATASSAIVTPASAKSRRGGNKLKSSLEQDATVGLALRRSDTDDATAAHDLTGRAVVVAPVSREMDAQVAVVLASEHRTVTGITDSGMSPRPYSAVTKSKCPIGYFSPCAGCNAPTVPLVGVHSHSIDTVRQACASETAAVVSAGWCWLVLPACANVCWYVRAVVGWKRRKMVEPFYLVRYTTDPKHRTGPVYGMMGSRCVLGNRLLCALEPPLVDPGQSVSVWYMMS